jgi:hypothetical protein
MPALAHDDCVPGSGLAMAQAPTLPHRTCNSIARAFFPFESKSQLYCSAGEVHLETIVKDLRERFARVEIRVSPPLVAFRESVYIGEEAAEPQQKPAKVQ